MYAVEPVAAAFHKQDPRIGSQRRGQKGYKSILQTEKDLPRSSIITLPLILLFLVLLYLRS